MITKILRDRIYIGDLVQHKSTKVNYKIKKTVKVNPKEYIIVPNNHEQIIDLDTFNTVQTMLDKQSNEWSYNKNCTMHLLRGLVYCSCGGKVTYNKNHGKHFRCVCSSYKKLGSKFCNNIQYLREDELIAMVLENLKKNVKMYLNSEKLNFNVKKNMNVKDNKLAIQKQIDLIDEKIKNIYQDKINGIITTGLFVQMSKEFEEKKKELKIRLSEVEKFTNKKKNDVTEKDIMEYVKKVLEFDNTSEIDRNLLIKLIDKIVIENKKIKSIQYNFNVGVGALDDP